MVDSLNLCEYKVGDWGRIESASFGMAWNGN